MQIDLYIDNVRTFYFMSNSFDICERDFYEKEDKSANVRAQRAVQSVEVGGRILLALANNRSAII